MTHKLNALDLVHKLAENGTVDKRSARRFYDNETRQRDQSEIGRLRQKVDMLTAKNDELEREYTKLAEFVRGIKNDGI